MNLCTMHNPLTLTIVFKVIRQGDTPPYQPPRRHVRRGKVTQYHRKMHGKGEKEREKE
jgi:hypothetical protein